MTNSIDSLTIKQGRLIETIHETANWELKVFGDLNQPKQVFVD